MNLFHAARPPHEIFHARDTVLELQENMRRVVEAHLRAVPELTATAWPLELAVRRGDLVASLTRGELVLKAEITRLQWWQPQSGRVAAMWGRQLSQNLLGYHRIFADADLSGRGRIQVWQAENQSLRWEEPKAKGRPVELVLEPGIYCGIINGNGSRPLLHQYGNGEGLTPEQALERRWISIVL